MFFSLRSVRRGSAMSTSCILATRSAKSMAILGSTTPEVSTMVAFASPAMSYSRRVRSISDS